jgi:hypothetical protein
MYGFDYHGNPLTAADAGSSEAVTFPLCAQRMQ